MEARPHSYRRQKNLNMTGIFDQIEFFLENSTCLLFEKQSFGQKDKYLMKTLND